MPIPLWNIAKRIAGPGVKTVGSVARANSGIFAGTTPAEAAFLQEMKRSIAVRPIHSYLKWSGVSPESMRQVAKKVSVPFGRVMSPKWVQGKRFFSDTYSRDLGYGMTRKEKFYHLTAPLERQKKWGIPLLAWMGLNQIVDPQAQVKEGEDKNMLSQDQANQAFYSLCKIAADTINGLIDENEELKKKLGAKANIEKMAQAVSKLKGLPEDACIKIASDIVSKGNNLEEALSALAATVSEEDEDNSIGKVANNVDSMPGNAFFALIRQEGNIRI